MEKVLVVAVVSYKVRVYRPRTSRISEYSDTIRVSAELRGGFVVEFVNLILPDNAMING